MDGMCNYLAPVTTLRALAVKRSSKASARAASVCWHEATIVLIIFTLAQVADGLLTYWGVTTLGIHVEGNGLLAAGMHAIGPFGALVSAKLLACVCGYVLYQTWRSWRGCTSASRSHPGCSSLAVCSFSLELAEGTEHTV